MAGFLVVSLFAPTPKRVPSLKRRRATQLVEPRQWFGGGSDRRLLEHVKLPRYFTHCYLQQTMRHVCCLVNVDMFIWFGYVDGLIDA